MGEIVIAEQPVLKCPALESNPDVCLGCYSQIENVGDENRSSHQQQSHRRASSNTSGSSACSRCYLPICSTACEKSGEHALECFLLTKFANNRSSRSKDDCVVSLVKCCQRRFGMLVAVVRVLSLMAQSTKQDEMRRFEQLMDMEPNLGQERSNEFQESLDFICEFIA
jgi:hypothetical protein